MDGKRWDKKNIGALKIPPAHPNCRCALVPFNEYSDADPEEQGGLVENFDKIAEEQHNGNDNRKKDWSELSWETKQQKVNEAIRDYEKHNGSGSAYVRQKGTFEDYLKGRGDEFQREWLGAKRYELWKSGKIKDIDQLVNPDTGYRRTLADLGVTQAANQSQKETLYNSIKQIQEEQDKLRKEIEEIENDKEWLAIREEINRLSEKFSSKKLDDKDAAREFIEYYEKVYKPHYEQYKIARQNAEQKLAGLQPQMANSAVDYVLGTKPTGRFEIDKVSQKATKEMKDKLDSATTILKKLSANVSEEVSRTTSVKIIKDEKRERTVQKSGNNEIQVSEVSEFSTIIHEGMHVVLNNRPALQQKVEDFVAQHKTGQTTKKHIDGKIEEYEILDIPVPKEYAGRIYEHNGKKVHSEMLTVWAEELVKNPQNLINNYPEFHKEMLQLLQ